jgi:hypothetical protein
MKKRWLTCGLVFVSVAVWLAGSAGSSGAAGIGDYARAADFDASGFSQHCDASPCPIVLISPWTFKLDTIGSPYDAVVTASFTYTTSRGFHVIAAPHLSDGSTSITLPSSGRPLPPARSPKSVTLTWLVPGLDTNVEYGLYVSVLPTGTSTPWELTASNMTLVVEGAPA